MTAGEINDTLDRLSRADAAEWLESGKATRQVRHLAIAYDVAQLAIDDLRAEVARLTQRAATAELALLSMTARVERAAAADVFAFDGDLDDAGYFCAVGL